MSQNINLDLKSLKLQIFNNLYDVDVNSLVTISELISNIKSDLLLNGETNKYRNILTPGDAKKFKTNKFKEASLIQYKSKKELNSFNKSYGLIIDIDKKDNPNIDFKALFNQVKQDNYFNIGFVSLSFGIKLIRFFDYPITNLDLLKGIKNIYFQKLESKYNIKIDYGAYKHTFLNSSNELFSNLDHTLNTKYWIAAAKEIIAKKESIINNITPDESDPPNLIGACQYLSTIKLNYNDWKNSCFGLANSFKSSGLKYWNIICNNSYYVESKHKQENINIWNNAIKKASGQSDFRAVIKIAINNGFIPGGR